MVGATQGQGKRMNKGMNNLPLPRGASAAKKWVAPTTSTPLLRPAAAPGEGGTREAQPRICFSQRTWEMPVVPRLVRRCVKVSNHNGECSSL